METWGSHTISMQCIYTKNKVWKASLRKRFPEIFDDNYFDDNPRNALRLTIGWMLTITGTKPIAF